MTMRSLFVLAACASVAAAQLVTHAVVRRDPGQPHGPLMATIEGREVRIVPQAILSWVYSNGEGVLYTTPTDKGQALRVYRAGTGQREELLTVPYEIFDVAQVHASNRQQVVVASMRDVRGVPSFGVVELPSGRKQVIASAVVTRIGETGLEYAQYDPADVVRMKGQTDLLKPIATERISFR